MVFISLYFMVIHYMSIMHCYVIPVTIVIDIRFSYSQ